ncbi:hypothetical protein N1031_09300 [Herbiconiux moechotypicola]|uniref:DUF5134 domain-containing protein n=1 Tax=Herbiconiux moechotypicola TaxID=637393 RepID=A0ABP5QF86_9MICO|nr:hypothetical protein [Herbiconiux moechotypicola]MCS5729955.1 hypothetical protein [Herbiconiux moechotypicola]
MTEALHLGALVPAAVGACCAVGARRPGRLRAVLGIVGAALMLLAMLDAATAVLGVPVLVWAGLLLAVAVASAAVVARPSGLGATAARPGEGGGHVHGAMALHGSLGAVVMAMLLVAMTVHGASADSASHAAGGAVHSGATGILSLVLASAAGYLVFGAVLAWRVVRAGGPRAQRVLAVTELTSMGLSTALMAATFV